MSAYNKFNVTVGNMCEGVHKFSTDTLKICLTNTAPVATNAVFGDLTEISAGNGYSAGGTALSSVTDTDSSGTVTLAAANVVFTSSTGTMGPFRYAVLYDATPTTPLKPLVGFWDYGSSISLNGSSGETFIVNLSSNIFTLT